MSVTTHQVTAYIAGTSTVLSVKGGSIVLDDSTAPHVQATLDIAMPSAGVLAALDTRMAPPPRIDISTWQTGNGTATVTRVWQLSLRDREVRHAEGIVRLTLASFEAYLDDFAPLADDFAPYNHQNSIRSLVNYVVGKAVPGTTLMPTPSLDGPVRALTDATNLIPNPRLAVNTSGWAANVSAVRQPDGGLPGIPTYLRVQSTGSPVSAWYDPAALPVSAGEEYTLSAWIFCQASGVTVELDAIIQDEAGNTVLDAVGQSRVIAGSWTRYSMSFTTPATATRVMPRIFSWQAIPSGQIIGVTGLRLTTKRQDPTDTGFFDGATASTTDYTYAWTGAANASTSTRIALIERGDGFLTWKAGQSAMNYLAPILQANGLRLVCDELRRFTLRDENYVAPGALAIRHGVNLIDGSDRISRGDALWFDAAVVPYSWTDGSGVQQRAIDAFALATPHTRVHTIERSVAYPGPGFAEYAVRRAQGRGREITVAAVSDFGAQAEQPISVALESTPAQTGRISRVEFNLDTDRMTVTTRTTDTPPGAIDLLTGTIDSLPGTIDSLI